MIYEIILFVERFEVTRIIFGSSHPETSSSTSVAQMSDNFGKTKNKTGVTHRTSALTTQSPSMDDQNEITTFLP